MHQVFEQFAFGKNIIPETDAASGTHRMIDKDMVRDSIRNIKNGKVAGPEGLLSETIKSECEDGVNTVTT